MPLAHLTLPEFLHGVFPPGTDPLSIHINAIRGDPHGPEADWNGMRLGKFGPLELTLGADTNQYFCIGVLDPKSRGRLAANVIASPIVALDDVGTKVPMARVRALLTDRGVLPTAALETSRGNFSLYYRLRGGSLGEAAAIRAQLKDLGLTDPGANDPARYMRLPFGINGKGAGTPWRVLLRAWRPELPPVPLEEWERALWGAAGSAERAVRQTEAMLAWGPREASLDDPLVRLAAEIGLDPHETRPGVIEARCPFTSEHSHGDPSGFAFVNWSRCHCHHGHCFERKSSDFKDEMVRQYDEQIALQILDGTLRATERGLIDGHGTVVPASGETFLAFATSSLYPFEHAALLKAFGP